MTITDRYYLVFNCKEKPWQSLNLEKIENWCDEIYVPFQAY